MFEELNLRNKEIINPLVPSTSNEWVTTLKYEFEDIAHRLFQSLQPGESLGLGLRAEDSLLIRFNHHLVRQNTQIEQIKLNLNFHFNQRNIQSSLMIQGNYDFDLPMIEKHFTGLRKMIRELPENPFYHPLEKHGQTDDQKTGQMISQSQLIEDIQQSCGQLDLAGLFAGGPMIEANYNSLGQKHWFSTQQFFFDYSIYEKEKAVKGLYAGSSWNQQEFRLQINQNAMMLEKMKKTAKKLSPGKYRVYLAPLAVAELVPMLGWDGVGYSSYRQGNSALKKLIEGEKNFHPSLHLNENFQMGLCPRFNSLGEVSPEYLELVSEGKFKNALISTATAKEYGISANGADPHEGPRTLEMKTGSLSKNNILSELGTGIYISNLHYVNWSDRSHARLTGMTRFACFWVENGQIIAPIEDLRFDVSLYDIWGQDLQHLTDFSEVLPQVSTYESRWFGGMKLPGMIVDSFTFTL